MNKLFFFPSVIIILFLSGCTPQEPICPPETGTPHYLTLPPEALPTTTANPFSKPVMVEIGGKTISVDKIIEGPLCNDAWSGTVYVTCNVQVYPWEKQPTFLKDCNLSITPGTVVYVAQHNDTPYYNGCSCHTNEITNP